MRRVTTIACVALLVACSQANEGQKPAELPLDSDKAKISYAIGLDMAKSLEPIAGDLDADVLAAAIKDGLSGREPRLTAEQADQAKQAFSKSYQERQMAKMKADSEKNKTAGDAYRTENGKKAGVTTTESGLQYEVLKQGDGPKPQATDSVTVHYKGTFINGEVFDQTPPDSPVTYPISGFIKGWIEGLQLMNVGSKYKLVLPPELGYGETGSGPVGPNSTLVFEIELVGIGEEKKAE